MSMIPMNGQTTQLTTVSAASAAKAFEPGNLPDLYRLCETLVASGLMPDGVKTPEAAFTIIVTGRELGLTAMQSIRAIHVIKGRPTLSAQLIVALIKRSPDCEYFQLIESTDKIATYETKRRDEPKPVTMSFTWEEALKSGKTGGDNWKNYTAAMLRARASSMLGRAVYPDVIMGIYAAEEDIDDEPRQSQHIDTRAAYAVDATGVSIPVSTSRALADRFAAEMRAAKTVDELKLVAPKIEAAKKSGELEEPDRLMCAGLYSECAKALKPTPKKADAPKAEATPEPSPAPPPVRRTMNDADDGEPPPDVVTVGGEQ